jgi:hypothetical protein
MLVSGPGPLTIQLLVERRNKPMGVKTTKRLLSVMIALIMVLTSVCAVFAAASPEEGTQYPLKTYGSAKKNGKVKGYLKVDTEAPVSDIQYSVNGKAYQTAKSYEITGLKEGNYVIIKTGDKYKKYRWMKSTKVSRKSGKTVKWTKTKGATGYYITEIKKNGKKVYKTVGSNVRTYKAKKGSTVRVRPLKKKSKSNIVYNGVTSKGLKVK